MTRSLPAMVHLRRWLMALMMVLASLPAMAQQSPEQLIRDSVNDLMGMIGGREAYFMDRPDELKQMVDESLRGVADFRYIGASVMGRYFNNATPEQRSRFAEVFKQTLLDTYAKGLVTFEYKEVRVLDNQSASRYDDQDSVEMEVVATDGTIYPVNYTLRKSNGQWRVVNVIVNGINLGLTFRNQFDQAMRDHNRDYDAVINNWSPDVGVDELERGA
ncbi:ABC transporter substrate-binding protein [Halomonas sp. YLB-10]|uniref:MlaC/ttg2D family ABC transporter substrate-binding protein n=1 Tax=Halomonas sp. YLB-10 TaxID=2483111 RepID=UPI000F5DC40D|nr:ABC transporter substrate-binding protein [Halomonas sp. YLB-10]RQW70649.1 ABC transporter substrate-binding protein [Halomonas sp. YLB-10]